MPLKWRQKALYIPGYRGDGNIRASPVVTQVGWLLWLTRWHKDNVIQYMRELNLTPANRDFIEDCVLRDWVLPKEVADERDTNE